MLYNVEYFMRYHGGRVCTIPDGGGIYYLGRSLDGISVFVEYVQMQYHRDLVLAYDPRHPSYTSIVIIIVIVIIKQWR